MKGELHLRHRDGLWARTANLLLSGWLVVSAFAWEQGAARTNAAVVAYLVFVLTTVAAALDEVRALNTLLGLWLVASAWLLPSASVPMRCSTTAVGAAVAVLSLVGKGGELRRPPLRALLARLEHARPR
jgi:hypothetical protein